MVRRCLLLLWVPLCLLAAAGCGGAARSATQPTVAPPVRKPSAATKRAALKTIEDEALRYYAQQGRPIFCGGRKRYAALTFDDGPGPYTPLARKWLHRYGVEATFFLVGRNVAPYATQARDERRGGYAIGDHSWTHPVLPDQSDAGLDHEIGDTQTTIQDTIGLPVALFRPPYGAHDARVDAEAQRLGMVQILWNVDSRDSEGADHDQIAHNVLSGVGPGAIVLMHENRGQTIRALWERILPQLRKRRLKLVSVPHLLAVDPPSKRQLDSPGGGCGGISSGEG
jgi:peptidoglycan/xylan/chitin deacetylase (PgdA/CDA1 family)